MEDSARGRARLVRGGNARDGEGGRADVGGGVEGREVERNESVVVPIQLLFGQHFNRWTPLWRWFRQELDLLRL